MYVGGTVISSVEFHGNMSLVIFMSKCPLACPVIVIMLNF